MMTSLTFLFYLFLWRIALATNVKLSVRQEGGFISADVGKNLTLRCFYESDNAAMFYWFKQTLGEKPRIVSTFYKHDKSGTLKGEFKNNPRFSLEANRKGSNLTILDLRTSDSATYYCISCYSYRFEFGEGAIVSVKGSDSNITALVHQSVSGTIQPGGSVTLNCTVHTGTCDGEHSVYWFKDSGESHPGIIYTHGDRNDQCERKPETQTHTCVYNLPIKSLSHAGTYYCAVALCGHIQFGNGTRLDFEGEVDSLVLVYFLSGALAFTTILVVVLASSVYRIIKANSCECTDSQARFSAPSTPTAEGDKDADTLHYAALREQRFNRARRQRDDTLSHCVYSTVKQYN